MKTSEQAHTPTPWRLTTPGTFSPSGVNADVKLPSGEKGVMTIAECDYGTMITAISSTQQDHHKRSNDVAFLRTMEKSNAQLIVTAVNNHFELLEALIAVRRHGLIEKDGYETIVKQVGEAIQKATNS